MTFIPIVTLLVLCLKAGLMPASVWW
jgi:hypothetical protein